MQLLFIIALILALLPYNLARGQVRDLEYKISQRHAAYVDALSIGLNFLENNERHESVVFIQAGFLYKVVGLEGSLIEFVAGKENENIVSFFPFGLYLPLLTVSRSGFWKGSVLNITTRAHWNISYSKFSQTGEMLDRTDFPPFLVICFEWRGPYHIIGIGYRRQIEPFKYENAVWANGLDLSGWFLNIRAGFSIVKSESYVKKLSKPPIKTSEKPAIERKAVEKKAVETPPSKTELSPDENAEIHYQKGLTAILVKSYYIAVNEFNIALSFKADHPDAKEKLKEIKEILARDYNDKGTDALLEGDYEEAIIFFLQSVAVNPNNIDIRNQLQRTYQKAEAKLQEENPQSKEMIKLKNQANAWQFVKDGLNSLSNGDLTNAERQFNRAIDIDKDFAIAHLYLGIIQCLRGDIIEAGARFGAALRLDNELSIPPDIGYLIWEVFNEVKERK